MKQRTQGQIMVLWEWPEVVWGAEKLVLWILESWNLFGWGVQRWLVNPGGPRQCRLCVERSDL